MPIAVIPPHDFLMRVPEENPETFPGIPLEGHLCSLRRKDAKFYWQVEKLIVASGKLPIQEMEVSELLPRIANGSWYGPIEKPTIGSILVHIERAIKADLTCPIILAADGKIMDGSHRLIGASIKGINRIPTVQFETDPPPDYIG